MLVEKCDSKKLDLEWPNDRSKSGCVSRLLTAKISIQISLSVTCIDAIRFHFNYVRRAYKSEASEYTQECSPPVLGAQLDQMRINNVRNRSPLNAATDCAPVLTQ
jgi:hypothetical protein